jgi:hypothetical protein
MPPLRLVNRRDAKRGKRLNSTALGALYVCHYNRHPSTLVVDASILRLRHSPQPIGNPPTP